MRSALDESWVSSKSIACPLAPFASAADAALPRKASAARTVDSEDSSLVRMESRRMRLPRVVEPASTTPGGSITQRLATATAFGREIRPLRFCDELHDGTSGSNLLCHLFPSAEAPIDS